MNVSFNLIDQPWLPCVRLDGQPLRLGLYDALAQAHTLRELQGEIPLSTAALHRLLLAILHRNFGPRNRSEWARLWRAGRWDAGALHAYFDRWRDRFDLFHEAYPFYQSATPPGEPQTLNRLSLTHAYNSTLFEHQAGQRHRYGTTLPPLPGRAAGEHLAGLGPRAKLIRDPGLQSD
jgi:CRISPR system Cascade subunit CasA